MYSMDCGGIEKAAVSILRALPKDVFDITLILDCKKGPFLNLVPKEVKVIELTTTEIYKLHTNMGDKKWLYYSLIHGYFKEFLLMAIYAIKSLFISFEQKKILRAKLLSKNISFSQEHFDYIFAYSNKEQLYYATNNYNADQCITWLHREIDLKREDIRYYLPLYKKCSKIYGVSQKVVDSFIKYCPSVGNITEVYYNLIDKKLGIELAEKYTLSHPNKAFWFLTVGRLTKQKGIDIIPNIALLLKNKGISFVWSIIGNGPLLINLKEKIRELELEDYIIVEGEKSNPYPYFKSCDVYLQPSRYEGYCITIAEARMFTKPIVATNFAGASEQLENGKAGKIVDFGIESFANGIIEVITNNNLQKQYTENLAKQQIDTTDTIATIIKYMTSNKL